MTHPDLPTPPSHLQVQQPGYQAFLSYACPGFDTHADLAVLTVPPGDDLEACPRPVLGVYDDHDYGGYRPSALTESRARGGARGLWARFDRLPSWGVCTCPCCSV